VKKRSGKHNYGYILPLKFILALILAACIGQTISPAEMPPPPTPTPSPEPTRRGAGGVLRILNWEAPTILNPHLSGAYKDWEASRLTYEPLASFDKNGELIPFLAAEIPGQENGGIDPHGKWVIWKLKQNIKWSDGEPFTADDVLFTYEFITNPAVNSTATPSYESVAGVEVIDDVTVKVNFEQATPSWALPFVGIQGMILPRHVFKDYNGANAMAAPANEVPVGTGPYRVLPPGIKPQEVLFLGTELVETNKIVYEPNPFFREEDKPFFSRVEWKGGGTVNQAAQVVLRDGEVDYAHFLSLLPIEELEALQAGGEGVLVTTLGPTVERIALNRTDPDRAADTGERSSLEFSHPFFSDKRVRQAFAYAVDREAIARLYGEAGGRPTTNNLVSPPQYASSHVFYEFDLKKAAVLLDEAGWVDTNGDGTRDKDGVRLEVVFQATSSAVSQKTQEIIKDALNSIGVEVELKIVDSQVMFSNDPSSNPNNYRRFTADLLEWTHSSFSPDPSSYMQDWTCNRIPQRENNWLAGVNIERWCSQEYDTLFQQSTVELDPDKRRQLFIQMNDMLIEDVVMIPLVHLNWISGAHKSIAGIDLSPWEVEVWNIKDWRRVSDEN
jgi:peptide/nickel transport system substrate-binding protein